MFMSLSDLKVMSNTMRKTLPHTLSWSWVKRYILRLDIILCAVCVYAFILFPTLDLKVSHLYFMDNKFIYDNEPVVRFMYHLFAKIHLLYLVIFLSAIAVLSFIKRPHIRRHFIFLTLCLLLGPGVMVNIILKDNSFGRPRPIQIQEFNGKEAFAPAFHHAGTCPKNCSFVSGHASIGFFLITLAWVRQRKIWIIYGIILGAIIGFSRILQGGHFLSDIIFAGWSTYFIYVLLARIMCYPSVHFRQ